MTVRLVIEDVIFADVIEYENNSENQEDYMQRKRIMGITTAAALFLSVAPLMAQDPYKADNNSWISLSGTVVSAEFDTFELDYGDGLVTVEMDDWDWYNEAYPILEGYYVVVHGMVDDDLYETTTIEANSVYVENLNTHFYANAADEEDVTLVNSVYTDAGLILRGEVTNVNGREFTIDTGSRSMIIDTDEMVYNPLDEKGYQQIDVGDFVEVTGSLDVDVFEKTEVKAERVITLIEDATKKSG